MQLTLLIFLVIGFFLQKTLSIKTQKSLSLFLNRFIIYLSLPSLVLYYLKDITLSFAFYIPLFTAWGVFLVVALALFVLYKAFNLSKELTAALIMLLGFGNTSFLGIPFTKAFFNEEAVKFAIIYDQLGSFLILNLFGLLIISWAVNKKEPLFKKIFKIITFPSFLALIFVFIFKEFNYPSFIKELTYFFATLLAPAALLFIGLSLKLYVIKEERLFLFLVLLFKLMVIPLIVFAIFKILNLNSLAAKVSIFESAMAPMITAAVVAIGSNLKPKFIATTLGYGIVISFFTLPIVYAVIS